MVCSEATAELQTPCTHGDLAVSGKDSSVVSGCSPRESNSHEGCASAGFEPAASACSARRAWCCWPESNRHDLSARASQARVSRHFHHNSVVLKKGVEPSRAFAYCGLNAARLAISAT